MDAALEQGLALVVDDSWRKAFPGACAGWLVLTDAANPPACPALEQVKQQAEAELAARYPDRAAIKADPVIAAYTAYYKGFKKTYHVAQQVETVAVKKKGLPRVAALVEAMFVAELLDGLLTAGHDVEALQPPARLMASSGGESFTTLSGRPAELKPGDMYVADQAGIISAVLNGPDGRTAITPQTTRAAFCVYAPAGVGPEAVRSHLQRIADYGRLIAPTAQVAALEVYTA